MIAEKIYSGASSPEEEKSDAVVMGVSDYEYAHVPVIFNQRLKLFGFNRINEMVHDFIKGKFPQITEDRQIDNLITNTQSNCLKSVLAGDNNRDFYERADVNDMYNYYLNTRKFHPKTCRDLTSYFKRFKINFLPKEL
jgi:hypothetical protein